MRHNHDADMPTPLVIAFLFFAALLAYAIIGLPMQFCGYNKGKYEVLKEAVEVGVLIIYVDPITGKRTYMWRSPAEAK